MKKMYFIIIVFQISSVKILCIFVFSCCSYEHLYNNLRIASQPAKSKILIMWPFTKKKKSLLTLATDLQFIKMGKEMYGLHPNLGTTQD